MYFKPKKKKVRLREPFLDELHTFVVMEKMVLIIAAGGKGSRFGAKTPKQFMKIDGTSIIVHSIMPFIGLVERVVVSIADGYEDYLRSILPDRISEIITIVPGGETRYDSVNNALKVVDNSISLVAIHDAARPYVDSELILRVMEKASKCGAAVPVVPIVDSIRKINPDGTSEVRDRSNYASVQTPQIFRSDILLEAYRQPFSSLFTDDASVVEANGHTIFTVNGSSRNIKITYPSDL